MIIYPPNQALCDKTDTIVYRIKDQNCATDTTMVLIIYPQCISSTASFTAPGTVCVNEPITITNTSTNANSYYWNFCVADINKTAVGNNLGNINGLMSTSTFMDITQDDDKFYGFMVNNTGSLLRLDFGDNLLNSPIAVSLGNLGGIIREGEGVQVRKNEGKWYVFIVSGHPLYGIPSRIVKVELGANITNLSPIIVDWGNIGGLYRPSELHIFKENNNWYGFTVNAENNTTTRFDFGNSFDNAPTGTNLGNLGNMDHPGGMFTINDIGNWSLFACNQNNTITRLDFGNSLLNPPTGVNLGNPGNKLADPRDIYIVKHCDQLVGFLLNRLTNDKIVRLNFESLQSIPTATGLGNIGSMSFPHSLTPFYRVGADLYSFIPNADNNTLTRLQIPGCTDANIPNSTLKDPPPITYTTPGTYNINLATNEGLTSQSSFCKQIVVLPKPSVDFSFEQELCNPLTVKFEGKVTGQASFKWDFGNSITNNIDLNPAISFNAFDSYTIKLRAETQAGCADSIKKKVAINLFRDSAIITRDTILCNKPANFTNFTLNALPALKYCWTPASGLSGTDIANPAINNFIPPTTYYLHAMLPSTNLITNGDFSQENTGFSSGYAYTTTNRSEGEYSVGIAPRSWNPGLSTCHDHTNGQGSMMMVNGASTADIEVWKQTISIKPNTNYAFSTWVQAISPINPARLRFAINSVQIGSLITASLPVCTCEKFYTIWNSGDNTTATISIVNKNTVLDGNDFALDDISFAELRIIRDSVTVGLHRQPEISFDYTVPVCKSPLLNGIAVNEPTPINQWQWNFGDTRTGQTQTLSHVYAKGGSYAVKLLATDINGCKDRVTQTIQLDTATAIATVGAPVCPGRTVTLQGSGGTLYEWTPAYPLNDPAVANPVATLTKDTRFHLKVTDAIGCQDTAFVAAKLIPKPAFIKPADMATCKGYPIILNAKATNAYEYSWSPIDYLDNPASPSPVATPNVSTIYTLHVTEPRCGYDTTLLVNVEISSSTGVFILPNAFTPNGDGKNDCFGIRNWRNTTVKEFLIYNRWGQKLFETKDPSSCWDGKYNGQLQTAGAYIYIIKALTSCGEVERRGSFLLIR